MKGFYAAVVREAVQMDMGMVSNEVVFSILQ